MLSKTLKNFIQLQMIIANVLVVKEKFTNKKYVAGRVYFIIAKCFFGCESCCFYAMNKINKKFLLLFFVVSWEEYLYNLKRLFSKLLTF